MTTAGLLLAAGAGTRMGRPKALVEGWLPATVAALLDGGCADVVVVLGARADEAAGLVPDHADVRSVVAADWADGISASLRAGLAALEETDHEATVLMLVDLPDITSEVIARLATDADAGRLDGRRTTASPGTRCCSGAPTGSRWRRRSREIAAPVLTWRPLGPPR